MKREQVREVDRVAIEEYGMSGLVLMENAGRGAAERAARFCGGPNGPVRILCGSGNNGGDGYVIARHLELAGFSVGVISLVPLEKLSGDAAANAGVCEKAGTRIEVAESVADLERGLADSDVIVDCMLGTGATGEPRGLYGDAVRVANQCEAKRVAIDLPTGLDCDSGEPSGQTFKADLTVTFVAEKDGFSNAAGKPFLGAIEVVGIGVPKVVLDRFGVSADG